MLTNQKPNNESNNAQPVKKVSAKRQKYLDRQAKKLLNCYSYEERKYEMDKCKKQLNDLGLTKFYNEDTQDIHKILDNYTKDGMSVSGHKNIEGTKRVFWYLLPQNKKNEISTCLKYDENI